MSRPVRPWFRFYTEAFNDRKILRLSPEQRWVWVAILGAARESICPGFLLVAEGHPMTVDELARYADVRKRVVTELLPILDSLGMMTEYDGAFQVLNWNARQFESDNVTARTQSYRERSREQDRNVPGNVRGNTPETETETESDKRTSATINDADFEDFYRAFPRRIGRGQAVKAWRSAAKKVEPSVIVDAAVRFAERAKDTEQRFIPHPATWLNGERWADEDETGSEDKPWWA